jgi:hypothetical protein
MKNFIIAVIALAAIVGFFKWTTWHDEQISIAAEKYAACVRAEYGVEPYTWYVEHGEYPTCPTKNQ